MGTWLAYDGATLTGLAENEIDEAFVSFIPYYGNRQAQRGLSRPAISTFLPVEHLQTPPVDPDFTTSSQLGIWLESEASSAVVTSTFIQTKATVERFLSAVSSAAVVAFVGHSIVIHDDPPGRPPFSVGMRFFDKDLIRLREPIDGAQWIGGGRGEADTRREWRLTSQAKIVFIASCYIAQEFKDLWGITDTTPGRMLIVPVDQDAQTDLLLGGKVWRSIADSLSRGLTVGQALERANGALPSNKRWMRIGGNDGFRLVKPPPQ